MRPGEVLADGRIVSTDAFGNLNPIGFGEIWVEPKEAEDSLAAGWHMKGKDAAPSGQILYRVYRSFDEYLAALRR